MHPRTKRTLSRALPWVAGLIFVAGVVAFSTVYLFDTGESVESQITDRETGAAIVPEEQPSVALDPEARKVAGRFILTAVTRANLAESYGITHPELRQGLSLDEWKTGNIPVQFYPAEAIDTATFKIDLSHPREALLQVALVPKEGANVKPQIFFIGLKKVKGKWLVNYWAPYSTPSLPTTE
jgi:hypothetical protein